MFKFVYDWLFAFNSWVFLKYLDLVKILLLGLEGIGEEILDMLAYLPLTKFGVDIDFLLSWEDIHCLKVISLSLTVNLSQLDLYIVIINFQDGKPKSAI